MLSLKSGTDPAWVGRIEENLGSVLVDHAHCEKKAAGTAMNMIFAYVEHPQFTRPLADLVKEELEHFTLVLELLNRRNIPMVGQVPSSYGKRLGAHIRTTEPGKVLDRCVVAALIEARSCERFGLLRDHLSDPELQDFYGSLWESEARHHGLYLKLAEQFVPADHVRQRLDELATEEARIIALGDDFARLHS